jgi:hypothetical protein
MNYKDGAVFQQEETSSTSLSPGQALSLLHFSFS